MPIDASNGGSEGDSSEPSGAPAPAVSAQAAMQQRTQAAISKLQNLPKEVANGVPSPTPADSSTADLQAADPAAGAASTGDETGDETGESQGDGEAKRDEAGKFSESNPLTAGGVLDFLRENPDELKAVLEMGGIKDSDDAASTRFIKLTRKRNRLTADTSKLAKGQEELTKREEALESLKQKAIAGVKPGQDILEALSNKHFAGVDAAFLAIGVDFDQYARERMRAGAEGVRESAASIRLKQVEKDLADARAGKPPKTKKPAEPQEQAEPQFSDETIESDIEEDHAVRHVAGWVKKVQELTNDEDTELSVEDAANKVLDAARAAMGAPVPRKNVRAAKPKASADAAGDELGPRPTDFAKRQRWAMKKAEIAARKAKA